MRVDAQWHDMKIWSDYKEYAKAIDPQAKADIEEAEELASSCAKEQIVGDEAVSMTSERLMQKNRLAYEILAH